MKVLSQLSGGIDSVGSTLKIAESGVVFGTIFFDLEQAYVAQESLAVDYFVEYLKENYPDTYTGHYYSEVFMDTFSPDPNTPSEYIPVRNFVLGAMSVNKALANGFDTIAVGSKTVKVRPGDPYSFSDCSIEFFQKMSDIATFCSENQKVEFIMPLIDGETPMTKQEVIKYLIDNDVDVSRLWSCYNGEVDKHCGVCYHCQEIKKTGYWDYFSR
jgi:7-cyano-7-deazaguanine synthase in queuosine biosynthesis